MVDTLVADGSLTPFAGQPVAATSVNGSGTDARFGALTQAVADAQGTLYVIDAGSANVRSVSPQGFVKSILETHDQPLLVDDGLNAVAVDPSGTVIVESEFCGIVPGFCFIHSSRIAADGALTIATPSFSSPIQLRSITSRRSTRRATRTSPTRSASKCWRIRCRLPNC